MRFPPQKLIQAIAARIKAQDGLLLVNEVTTGMGRTGKWFGYQHYNLSPDLVALGKGIGNAIRSAYAPLGPHWSGARAACPYLTPSPHQNDPLGRGIGL